MSNEALYHKNNILQFSYGAYFPIDNLLSAICGLYVGNIEMGSHDDVHYDRHYVICSERWRFTCFSYFPALCGCKMQLGKGSFKF